MHSAYIRLIILIHFYNLGQNTLLTFCLYNSVFVSVCWRIRCRNNEGFPGAERQSQLVPCSMPKPRTKTYLQVYILLAKLISDSRLSFRIRNPNPSFHCKEREKNINVCEYNAWCYVHQQIQLIQLHNLCKVSP